MGFRSVKEYNAFLKQRADSLMDRITNDPKLLDVLKRLNSK